MKNSFKFILICVLVEIFIFTQFGGLYINEIIHREEDYVNRMIRRGFLDYSGNVFVQQAEREGELSVGARGTDQKTEHIFRAVEYYKEAFKTEPANSNLVNKLKAQMESSDISPEEQLISALVLINLMDSQGVSEEYRLRCLEKIKKYQYWVSRPKTYENRIDMHLHTFRSDGMATPAGIVLRAWQEGMKAIGVVDHNTFSHIYEAVKAGEILGIEVTPGVEFDVVSSDRNIKNMHILSYFDKGSSEDYKRWLGELSSQDVYNHLERLKQAYIDKTAKMVENFNNRRFSAENNSGEILVLTEQDLKGYLSDTPSKYQFGMALLAKYGREKLGVGSYREATEKYFSDVEVWHWQEEPLDSLGGEATYIKVSPDGINLDEMMQFAVSQGGTVILPHPGEFLASDSQTFTPATRERKLEIYRSLLRDYATVEANGKEYLGIRGFELYSSKNTSDDVEDIAGMLEFFNKQHPIYNKYPLIATTGTDAHSQDGQGVELCIGQIGEDGRGNIPWIASTYIFYEKLKYQMGIMESAAKTAQKLSSLNLQTPRFATEYELGEYIYWAEKVLNSEYEISKRMVEQALPFLLQRDVEFRHLTADTKAAIIKKVGYLMDKTGQSAEALINKAAELARGQNIAPYSFFIKPGSRIALAESLGISKTNLLGDWFRDWVDKNGDKLFIGGVLGGTVCFMALFAKLIGWDMIHEMGGAGVGLFAALEIGAAPLFFKVSELLNKFLAGKLSPDIILPEVDFSTYGYEETIVPSEAFSMFIYCCGSPRKDSLIQTLEANPGVPIMVFSYKQKGGGLEKVQETVEGLNEKYGEGYPGGKAVLLMSQSNIWWEGPNPGPKHGNLEDLYEWLADMDRGYEATSPDYQDDLRHINRSRRTFAELSERDFREIDGRPEVTFFNENFRETGEPAALQEIRQIATSGKNSTEQLKNLFRQLAPGTSQIPLWYTLRREEAKFDTQIEARNFVDGFDANCELTSIEQNDKGKWVVKYNQVYFNPEYIKRDFKWVDSADGYSKIVVETWAVWEDPDSGEKTYVRERKVLFDGIIGDKEIFQKMFNVIPLDGDSGVPIEPKSGIGNGIRLLQKAMASANHPVLDEDTMMLKSGYGLIQPLQLIGNVDDTQWTELMARERRRMIYDQQGQMNMLGSGVDYGKGLKVIRDQEGNGIVGWVLKSTGTGTRGGRRNSIKPSPDIGEGSFLRPAFALDLFFTENEQPRNYIVDSLRSGKWGTGDLINGIQDLLPYMVNAQGVWVPNPYSAIDRFRIFSNSIGIGTNAVYPFWMGLWAMSAFMGVLAQTGVVDPTIGYSMFASTAGLYILLSKVIPEGKNFMLGDFVKTQALMANVLRIPSITARGMYKFVTGKELTFPSTSQYQKEFDEIGLKDIYLSHKGKLGLLFWPAITGVAVTGTAIVTQNMPWLTWGSVLSASLASSGIITYFTGRDRSEYKEVASRIEEGSTASGYRMLGDAWRETAEENMTTKTARLKDVMETYGAFKEMVDKGRVNLKSLLNTKHLVKNPTLYAKVLKDFMLAAIDSNAPKMEYLKRAIWDNLTSNERRAFINITGNESSAKELFFEYINATYNEIYQEEEKITESIVTRLGIKDEVYGTDHMQGKVHELGNLLERAGFGNETDARKRLSNFIRSTVEENPDITRQEILRGIDKSIAGTRVWMEFQNWLSGNPNVTPYERLEKFNELMQRYDLLEEIQG